MEIFLEVPALTIGSVIGIILGIYGKQIRRHLFYDFYYVKNKKLYVSRKKAVKGFLDLPHYPNVVGMSSEIKTYFFVFFLFLFLLKIGLITVPQLLALGISICTVTVVTLIIRKILLQLFI